MARRGVFVLLFTLLSGLIGTFAALGSAGSSTEEEGFVAAIARERTAAGRPGYEVRGDLVEVARRHAARMASQDRLHHNPALASEVQGWNAVGENVGVGATVESIHQAFMDSRTHRDGILSGTYTEVGVGVALGADGALWVAQVFRRPESAPAAAPSPAPAAPRPVRTARAEAKPVAPPAAPEPAPAAPVDAAPPPELMHALAADLTVPPAAHPAPVVLASRVSDPAPVASSGDRRVTTPIAVAAAQLLAVVLGLLVVVGRYPLSDWRRQRNQASISSSRSPSSTAWTFPVS